MRVFRLPPCIALLVFCSTGCHSHKVSQPPQQAQAPPLQTGGGTLTTKKNPQPQEKNASPLASPLPPPSAQAVALPPPPPPKKVRHRKKTPKPVEPQTVAATSSGPSASAQSPIVPPVMGASPIGQLTTGDSAAGERTKHETADLIGSTQQGMNGIKRPLSADEKVTVAQIRTFLSQAQKALDSGDADGAHTLATKARLLLDELTKP
jgi:hypothetical protein